MKKKTYDIEEEYPIEVKRLYLPFKTEVVCPSCKNKKEIDLNFDYLSYPILNKKESFYIYCNKCDIEFETLITLKLNITIE